MTGSVFGAEEALQFGFVTKVLDTKTEALGEALQLAEVLASKSPVAVQGTKEILNYSRDHGVDNGKDFTILFSVFLTATIPLLILSPGMRYTQVWNAAYVQSDDVKRAVLSSIERRKPTFEKL